jgi:hypothetical protein
MNFKSLSYAIAFILLLLVLEYAQEDTESSIVWVSLEKESMYGNLEYAGDISNYISADKNIIEKIDDKFLLQSFGQLFRIHQQSPNQDKTARPEIERIKQNVNIWYNLSFLGDSARLIMQYGADGCGLHYKDLDIKEPEIYDATEKFIENISACITTSISSQNSSYTFLGTDHGLSLLTVKAAKKLDPKAKIGIIVFDEHVDIYGTKDKNNIIGKENVFGKLLVEGYAEYIVFLQTSEAAKQWAKYSVDQNFTRHDIFKKTEIYSDKDLMKGKWKAILSKSMINMKKAGITNIIISIDLDALPTRYTGFEYSIIAPAIAAIRFGSNRSEPSFAETEEGFSKGLEVIEIKNYNRWHFDN